MNSKMLVELEFLQFDFFWLTLENMVWFLGEEGRKGTSSMVLYILRLIYIFLYSCILSLPQINKVHEKDWNKNILSSTHV